MRSKTVEQPVAPELASALLPFRRRAYLDRALRFTLLALAAWAGAAALVFAWSKLSPTSSAGAIAAGLGACALLGGFAAWSIQRPTYLQVARVADARLDLKERLASALYFAGTPGELHRRLRLDAAERAREHRPREAFPLRQHRRRALAAGLSVAVVAALALTPNPQAGALARRSADHAVISQAKKAVRVAKKDLRLKGGNNEATQAEQELERALQELQRARTPLQALTALSALQSELSALPNLSNQAEAAATAAGLALAGAPGAAKLSADLSRGDLKAAANDLRQLAKALSSLSPAEQSALAKALANAAKEAASQQAAGHSGSQQSQQPPGSTASGNNSLSSELAQAAQALASGKRASASKDLSSAASGAQSSASAASFQQELAAIRAGIRNAQNQAAAQAQADTAGHSSNLKIANNSQRRGLGAGGAVSHYALGSGTGKTAGRGAVFGHGEGYGSGGGTGNGSGASKGGAGAGSGNGSGSGSGGNKRPSDQVFVGGQPGTSQQVVGKHLGDGYKVKTTDYQNVLPGFEKTALQGLGSQVVSPSDENLVRDYFSSLGGGKK